MNSNKDKILPVIAIKLGRVNNLYAVLVNTSESLHTTVYETESRGLAELVLEDLGRQIASGERLLRVCEPGNRRLVELTTDQIEYLVGLVERDSDKKPPITEGDYYNSQLREQVMKRLGRYII